MWQGKVYHGEEFHGRQSSDERLYSKRSKGGRGLKSFKEVYVETKTWVACYMAAAKSEWIRIAWRNESQKEQISLKKEVEKAMKKVEVIVSSLHKKWSFPLRISSVNVTKSTGNCGFDYIYWIYP